MEEEEDKRIGTAVTWLGHATVILQMGGTTLLIDPLLRERILLLRRTSPLAIAAALNCDAVLVSHAHHDHLDVPSLRMFEDDTPMYAPSAAQRYMQKRVMRDVSLIRSGEQFQVGAISIDVVRAHHPGGRYLNLRREEAVGFVMRSPGYPSVYVAGDTSLFPEMRDFAPVDVALLPVGGWWKTLGPGHLDVDGAVEAALAVGAQIMVPVHWGTFYPLGFSSPMQTHWSKTPGEIERAATARAPHLQVSLIRPGGTTLFSADTIATKENS